MIARRGEEDLQLPPRNLAALSYGAEVAVVLSQDTPC